ncbi:MAG TPA: sugar-binding domain-containing protein [Candidatus Bathyarchaeia archaeon]|nr:sugar-binding domain-containing protein [Candidatus Bathyarchaeia archaeon]
MTDGSASATLPGQVARLFFERQLTKVEIATRLGISRFRVARLIDQALADGIVRIEFRDTPDRDLPLARAVEERYGLEMCVVAGSERDTATSDLARVAGEVVDGLLGTGEAIGLAWGSTVAGVVDAIPTRNDASIDVVQLAGSSTSLDAATDPGDLTRVLAARLGGRPHRIHAPAFVETAELRAALVREPELAATIARFDDLAIALLGIGAFPSPAMASPRNVASSSLLRSGSLSSADVARLGALGAVGDLLVHPFDAGGRFVARDIAERAVAIDVERLRRVPRVVAVAAGRAKVRAIRGALATQVIRILVTDAATAASLVGPMRRPPRATRRPPRIRSGTR